MEMRDFLLDQLPSVPSELKRRNIVHFRSEECLVEPGRHPESNRPDGLYDCWIEQNDADILWTIRHPAIRDCSLAAFHHQVEGEHPRADFKTLRHLIEVLPQCAKSLVK